MVILIREKHICPGVQGNLREIVYKYLTFVECDTVFTDRPLAGLRVGVSASVPSDCQLNLCFVA